MFRFLLVPQTSSILYNHTSVRGLLYSPKKGTSRDFLAWLQQPFDFSLGGIRRWLLNKERGMLLDDHKFIPDRHDALGPDLATAHFVVARDGAVKFEDSSYWIAKEKSGGYNLPSINIPHLKLEAVDMSETKIMYRSFDNFVRLTDLKYLNLSRCPNIDDWCLDRLVQLRDTLLVLDISGCSLVTERGVASLHRLRSLRRLILNDMPNVKYLELTIVMLEQILPQCVISGSQSSITQSNEPVEEPLPAFMKQYMAVSSKNQ